MNPRKHNYATVAEWDEKRTIEISRMLKPYLEVTDAYVALVCEIVDIVGTQKPISTQDIVVRDLLADVFDALVEARRIILTGKCSTAYPIARRVYESLSLMALCALDSNIAVKWHSGLEIQNFEVRKGLTNQPHGEAEDATKKLYKFFTLGAHPNRDLIPRRFLGEGNEFVLGSVCDPNLVLVTEYCTIHLRMWFWFTAVLLKYHHQLVDAAKPDLGARYLSIANRAQQLQAEFERNYERLLREDQARQNRV